MAVAGDGAIKAVVLGAFLSASLEEQWCLRVDVLSSRLIL